MSLRLIESGLLSLLVDFGRVRSRALGVPVGGAADRAALAIGNALVGNPPDAPAIEFTLSGPTLQAEHSTACVVFGAPFAVTIDQRPVEAGTTFTLAPGDLLRIGGTPTGARGYLCVAGGFGSAEILDSRSTLDPLKTGDVLACPPSRCEPRGLGFSRLLSGPSPQPLPPTPSPMRGGEKETPSPLIGEGFSTSLRVLDGPQRDWFADDRFFTHDYEVTPASNRMGLRLKGEPISRRPGELTSEAVAPGAVQITNDGLPVILGVDGQTIGGYPKVAHVIRADLDLLGQLRPGDRVRFIPVSPEEAQKAATARNEMIRGWLTRLRAADRCPVLG
jgi:antagonist of KipI